MLRFQPLHTISGGEEIKKREEESREEKSKRREERKEREEREGDTMSKPGFVPSFVVYKFSI